MIQAKQDAILEVVNRLLKANNTVTCLEIKAELRVKYEDYNWTEQVVSDWMDQNYMGLGMTYFDNGTYRTYSYGGQPINQPVKPKRAKAPSPKPAKKPSGYISRSKALGLMQNNKGHFYTAIFIDKDNAERKMSCQYMKNQTDLSLGYVLVKEAIKMKQTPKDCIRRVNLQTLKSLSIAGKFYKIR